MSVPAVTATSRIEPGFVRQRAAALVRQGKGARVLLLHGRPHWDGEPSMVVEGHTVHVRAGVSQLAILDAYANLPEDDYLVVVTDRTRQDLGDAVLLHAWHREIQLPDLWGAVPALYGAHDTARDLRRAGPWVPSALLAHTPPTGWPASPGPEVTADFALGNLVAHQLGLPLPESLDADLVLSRLGDARTRASWQSVEASLRRHLVTWSDEHVGAAVTFALRCAEQGSAVAPLALALAVDVLWSGGGERSTSARGVAAGRLIERHLGGHPLTPDDAHEIARAGRAAISRQVVTEPETARNLLAQAEALLGDLGWPEGAAASDLLPAGLTVRLRGLGAALDEGAPAAEAALQRLLQHLLAGPDSHDVLTARMAVRLARWRATAEGTTDTLSASLRRQLDDGAWVDRALTLVWNGSDDPELSAHYASLVTAVQVRRFERDRVAAGQLAQQTAHPISLEAAVPIEDLLSQVVKPWSSGKGVLLVVLDGMSAAVATEVTEAAGELGFAEWVPQSGRRLSALSVLPSLTSLSRASLFAGALGEGGPAVEKRAFAAAFPGAPLFHKNDLRADAGAQLPPEVTDAIATDSIPVVGVVINTIDDTLHKQDPSSMRWTLERLAPLRALLSEAVAAGRAVVLTSDHGHVIERASQARSLPGASARWRSESTGPVSDGEVLLAGTRVLTDGGRAVLLWREDVHYGPRQTGYHGGASLAEVTVPVVVLQPAIHSGGTVPSPAGWAQAAPQAPEWWNEPARPAISRAPAPRRTVPGAHPGGRPNDGPTLFDLATSAPQDATGGDLVDAVLASTTYSAQKARAGRRSADDATVAAILRALLQRGNRAHRDTLATAGGVPATAIESTLAAVKRLVNVDGYAVLEQDADLVTLKLDVDLLRDQFGGGVVTSVSTRRRQEIIDSLRRGTVPHQGLDVMAVGLQRFEQAIDDELRTVAGGGAQFKAVRGEYGSGKTFFTRWLTERARAVGFAGAEIQVSETETPLHRLETVYRRVTESMTTPSFRDVIDGWFFVLDGDVRDSGAATPAQIDAATETLLEQRLAVVSAEAPAFAQVLRAYRTATAAGDRAQADALLAWLGGQPHVAASVRRAAGVRGDIDHYQALGFLQGLLTVLRDSDYRGLVLVLDEVETLQRVRSDVREKSLNALRQLMDEVDAGRFPGLYLVMTGTPAFYDGPQGVQRLAPLAQRLQTDFTTDARFDNPRATQIRLAGFSAETLVELGVRVRDIYATGSDSASRIRTVVDDTYVADLAAAVSGDLGGRTGVAPRLFLKKLVADVLDRVDQFPDFDPRRHYALTVAAGELTATEREARSLGRRLVSSADDVDLDL